MAIECFYCKQPARGGFAFELIEDIPGKIPVKRRACFPCLNDIGEKIMRPPQEPAPPA